MNAINYKSYNEPEFDRKEILRYAGCREANETINSLLEECIDECKGTLCYKVCYSEYPISVNGESIDLGFAKVESKHLAKNLEGCERIVLFSATVGLAMDRLIARYSRISPAKAHMFQAMGAERVESLCDVFNDEITKKSNEEGCFTRPRFSPGYGDVPLSLQREIFAALDCERKLGITLNTSLLMSPSKSVTAIIGIGKKI